MLAQGNAGLATWLIIGLLALLLVLLLIVLKFVNLWVQAVMTRTKIGILQLVGMWLRKVDPTMITRVMITSNQAGLPLDVRMVEAHVLAGGSAINVVHALIAADRASLGLDFNRASAIDLAGRDILDAVRASVNPRVIDCPPRGRITAMAKDGIQILARARVTVRTNLARLVGGATEETITARVGEGIVATIGSTASHKAVLENPNNISRRVLEKGLDAGTAFEILSIDIADLDIGDNIGARLQADQAEADKRVAQAAAESRRAMAVAFEQEQTSDIAANRALVVLAEAQVPLAMADALRARGLGPF